MEIRTSESTKLHLAQTAINEGETVISTMTGAFSEAENIYQGAASRMSDEDGGVTEEDVETAIRSSLSPQEIASFNRLPPWAARSIRRKVRRELEHKYQAYQLKKEDDSFDGSRRLGVQAENSRMAQGSGQGGRNNQNVWGYEGQSGATKVSASSRTVIREAADNGYADAATDGLRMDASMKKTASYSGDSTKSDSLQTYAISSPDVSTDLGVKATGTNTAQTSGYAGKAVQTDGSGGITMQATGYAGKRAQAGGPDGITVRATGYAGKKTQATAGVAGKAAQGAANNAGKAAGNTAKTAGTAAKAGASAGTGAATGGVSLAVQGAYEAAKAYVTVSVATANWLRTRVSAQQEKPETEALSTDSDKNLHGIERFFTDRKQEKGNEDGGISGVVIFAVALAVLIVCLMYVYSSSSADYDTELPTEIASRLWAWLPV